MRLWDLLRRSLLQEQTFLRGVGEDGCSAGIEDAKNCPFGELLDVSQRLKTASEVNAAILTSQSREQDPKLPSLLKLLIWAQNQLDEKAVFPCIEDPTV